MNIQISEKYDFCGIKDVYINGRKSGRVLKDGNTFDIEIEKVIKEPNKAAYTVYKKFTTSSEDKIIHLICNLLNNH